MASKSSSSREKTMSALPLTTDCSLIAGAPLRLMYLSYDDMPNGLPVHPSWFPSLRDRGGDSVPRAGRAAGQTGFDCNNHLTAALIRVTPAGMSKQAKSAAEQSGRRAG